MSNAAVDGSRRIPWMRIVWAMALGLILLWALVAYRAYTRYAVEQRWMSEMERLGARTFSSGTENTSTGIGRVPVLGELVTHRRRIELFLDNPATVDAVLDKAAELPELPQLGRVWVDQTVFERSMADRIKQKLPGIDVIFYTP